MPNTYIFAAFKFEPNEVKNYLTILKTEKMVDYIKDSIADHLINEGKEIGEKKGKEQGMKVKKAIISLRSLFLFFPLRSTLPIKNIAKIADVKIDIVKKFYKSLLSSKTDSIKELALSLLFKKIVLETKDHQEIDMLIKEFQQGDKDPKK